MPDVAATSSRPSPSPALVLAATVLACLPILGIAQFAAHARVDEFDAWLFAYYGREMVHGRALYADLWDNKPPGIFWLNALGAGLSGGSLLGIRVLCVLAVSGAAAVVFAATKRLYGWSAAGIATVLAALYLNLFPYHVGCNRPNTFFVLTELACIALYLRAVTGARHVRWSLLAAGVCAGAGVCLHQTALAAAAAVGVHTVYLLARRRWLLRDAFGRLACFAGGWLATVALAAAAIVGTSDPRLAWYAIVGFNRLYFMPGVGSSLMPRFFEAELHIRVLALPAILAAATLVQPVLRRWLGGVPEADDDPVGKRPEGLLVLLWAWMLGGIYLALVGPHQRLPYFGIALPPLVLLSAHGVYLLLRSGRRITAAAPAYPTVVGVLWIGYMLIFPLHEQLVEAGKQYYKCCVEAPDRNYLDTLAAIRQFSRPDESLFVFGYGPQFYWDAERPSAIRYIGTEKAGQLLAYGQPVLDEITALLKTARPKVIVLDREQLRRPGEGAELDLSQMQAWIEEHYARPPGGRPRTVWVRRD